MPRESVYLSIKVMINSLIMLCLARLKVLNIPIDHGASNCVKIIHFYFFGKKVRFGQLNPRSLMYGDSFAKNTLASYLGFARKSSGSG